MAFGLSGSDSGTSNGEFLGRLQFDARSGLWKHFTRRNEGGQYFNDESEDYMNPSFLMDFGSLEVGYAKISNPPSFLMVPFGKPAPQRPRMRITMSVAPGAICSSTDTTLVPCHEFFGHEGPASPGSVKLESRPVWSLE